MSTNKLGLDMSLSNDKVNGEDIQHLDSDVLKPTVEPIARVESLSSRKIPKVGKAKINERKIVKSRNTKTHHT